MAQNEQIDAVQDTALIVDAANGVLANDPGAALVLPLVQLLRTSAGGQIYFDTDGSYKYISAPGFSGTDTVQYTTDNAGTGTLTLNVAATAMVPFVSVGDQLGARHQIMHGFGFVGDGVATQANTTPVALAGGGYVIGFSYLDQAFGSVVDVRTFDANHNLLSVFDAGVIGGGLRIAALSNGGYAVAYGVRSTVDPNDPNSDLTQTTSVRVFDAAGHSLSGPTPFDVPGPIDGISGLSALPNGGFVLLQTSVTGSNPNQIPQLYAQSFSAAGVPESQEYAIGTSDQTRNPTILANGEIVLSQIEGSNFDEVHLQRYDPHGNPIGSEIVPTSDGNGLAGIRMFARPEGGFVVAWMSVTSIGTTLGRVAHVQIVDADGHLVGAPATTDLTFSRLFGDPVDTASLTPLADGGFVVRWRGVVASGIQDEVQAYDANGNAVGSPIFFDAIGPFGSTRALVFALPAGGFAVGLQSADPANHNLLIYDNNGGPVGQVRMHDAADGTGSSTFVLANLPNGDSLILSNAFGTTTPTDDITVQTIRFDRTTPAIQTGEIVKDAAAIVPVKIYIPDPDGSEIVQSIDVSGVPAGWQLDYHSATATFNGGVWTITGPAIAHGGDINLHLVAPLGTTGSATLLVVAHTIDTDNGSQSQSFPATFTVNLSPAPPFQYAGSVDPGPHPAGYQVAGIGDFNADGTSDILWRNSTTGQVEAWRMKDGHWDGSLDFGSHGTGWNVAAVGDFNGDGTSDVLWREAASGKLDAWIIKNGQWQKSVDLGSHGADWQVLAASDFNGDGTSDILFRNTTTGQVDEWQMSNGNWSKSISLGSYNTAWTFGGAGDLDHDGTSDILWRNPTTGQVDEWRMVDGQWKASTGLGGFNPAYDIVGVVDFNGNGSADVLFRNPTTGQVEGWVMSAGQWSSSVSLGTFNPAWQFAGTGDFNHTGGADVLWHNAATGQNGLWLLDQA